MVCGTRIVFYLMQNKHEAPIRDSSRIRDRIYKSTLSEKGQGQRYRHGSHLYMSIFTGMTPANVT